MKKIIISLILILSLTLLCSCDILNSFLGNSSGGATDGNASTDHGEHEDENNSGKCDICSVSVIIPIDFFAINDLHGKFNDSDSQPGVDELTTYLKGEKEDNENTIFLASGDIWQGSAESNLTNGIILTEWMNELGFTSMTMGNHEYDWGEERIEYNDTYADFPFLAINVFDRETNQRVSYCDASTVVDLGEVQVGIIGAIGDVYSSISQDKVDDVYFITDYELTKLVKAESERLRASGVDIVIYSIHDGYNKSSSGTKEVSSNQIASYYDSDLSSGGYVDLVFEGHTHKRYVLKDTYGVYHLQSGGENKNISHVEMNYNTARDECTVITAENVSNSTYSREESDALVGDLLNKYADILAKGYEVLGNNPSNLSSGAIKSTVARLYLETGIKTWGAEYDIVLGGGYLSTRSPYDLDAGEVTYADIYTLLPFDNNIVLCSISGGDLKRRFVNSDNSDYYISYSEYGKSIISSIDDNETYYIIVDTYSSQYAPNRLTVIETLDDVTFARDLFAEYIKSGRLN